MTSQYTAGILLPMTPLVPATFRLEAELIAALQELKERDGVPATESVRRAIKALLELKGVDVKKSVRKSDRKRGLTRKRS